MAFVMVNANDPSRIFANDSYSYISSATALLKTGRFAISPENPEPQLIRTPGYPAYMAGIYLIFGEDNLPVVVFQILISIVTVFLVYIAARELWDDYCAIAAIILFSVDPGSFFSSQMILSETLFTFFIMVMAAASVHLWVNRKPRIKYLLVLGLALAFATLVRPISYYLLFPIIIMLIALRRRLGLTLKDLARGLIYFVLPWIMLVGGWQVRNYMVSGNADFSHVMALDLLFYRGAGIIAEREDISLLQARELVHSYPPVVDDCLETELTSCYKKKAFSLMVEYPGSFLRVMIRGLARLITDRGDAYLLNYLGVKSISIRGGPAQDLFKLSAQDYISKWVLTHPIVFVAFILTSAYLIILYVGSISGLVSSAKEVENQHIATNALIWTVIIYLLIVSAGPEANVRFRTPIMPLLSIFAGKGMVVLMMWGRKLKSR